MLILTFSDTFPSLKPLKSAPSTSLRVTTLILSALGTILDSFMFIGFISYQHSIRSLKGSNDGWEDLIILLSLILFSIFYCSLHLPANIYVLYMTWRYNEITALDKDKLINKVMYVCTLILAVLYVGISVVMLDQLYQITDSLKTLRFLPITVICVAVNSGSVIAFH